MKSVEHIASQYCLPRLSSHLLSNTGCDKEVGWLLNIPPLECRKDRSVLHELHDHVNLAGHHHVRGSIPMHEQNKQLLFVIDPV
jgi:hypothetical protein